MASPKLSHAFAQVVAVWAATCVFATAFVVASRASAEPVTYWRDAAAVVGGPAAGSRSSHEVCAADVGVVAINNVGRLVMGGGDAGSTSLFAADLSRKLAAFPGATARFGSAVQPLVSCTLGRSWQLGYAQGQAFELTMPGATARWLGAQTGGDAGQFSPGQTVRLSAFEQRLETKRIRLGHAWSATFGGWRVSGKAVLDALTADRFNRLYGGGTGEKAADGALATTLLYNELIAEGQGDGYSLGATVQIGLPHSPVEISLQAAPLWGQIHWDRAAWRTLVLDTSRTPTPEGLQPLVQGVQHFAPLDLTLVPTLGAAVRVPVAWKGAGYVDVSLTSSGPRVWAAAHVGGGRSIGIGRLEWRVGRDQNLGTVTEPAAGISYGQTPPITGWTFGAGWTLGGGGSSGGDGAPDERTVGATGPVGADIGVGVTLDDRGHLSSLQGDLGISLRW